MVEPASLVGRYRHTLSQAVVVVGLHDPPPTTLLTLAWPDDVPDYDGIRWDLLHVETFRWLVHEGVFVSLEPLS